jgi:hypothetical protein
MFLCMTTLRTHLKHTWECEELMCYRSLVFSCVDNFETHSTTTGSCIPVATVIGFSSFPVVSHLFTICLFIHFPKWAPCLQVLVSGSMSGDDPFKIYHQFPWHTFPLKWVNTSSQQIRSYFLSLSSSNSVPPISFFSSLFTHYRVFLDSV